MENRKRKAARTLLLAGIIVCLIPFGQAYGQSRKHSAQQEILREMVAEAAVQYPVQADSVPQEVSASVLLEQAAETDGREAGEKQGTDTGGGQTGEKPVMLERYAGLYEENQDLVGWLSIEDMKIDYPVMQNEDDRYYLHRDFYGNDSKYGCLCRGSRLTLAPEQTLSSTGIT